MFEHTAFDDHESVHFFRDTASGLRAIIAIHSTALGPSAGGCRMWAYDSEAQMLTDALRLSQGMSYKNALAGLDHGGGKAVIWGCPHTQKSTELFGALGRAIDSLSGRYWTAEDVGLSPEDLIATAQETKYVAGLDDGVAASGDPSPVTARGVYHGLRETAARAFGSDDLSSRTIAVQGVGHVGGGLCRLLAEAGARLIITDTHHETLVEIAKATGARVVAPDEIYDVDADIFSPNALGATLNSDTISRLKVKAIAGGANNQLQTPQMGEALVEKGILYAPDYVINGGGIINVASEISGTYSIDWVNAKLDNLITTLGQILDEALRSGLPPHVVADAIARKRIGRLTSEKSG